MEEEDKKIYSIWNPVCYSACSRVLNFQVTRECQRAIRKYERLEEYVKEVDEEGSAEIFAVDFAALKQINSDIVAWLWIPRVLDYPPYMKKIIPITCTIPFKKSIIDAGVLDARNMVDFPIVRTSFTAII